jgi:glycerol kinase
MAGFVGALDQGTTSTRFMIFDYSGQVAGAAPAAHHPKLPRPGWVEHNPEEIWQRAQEVIAQALGQAGLRAGDLAAVGVANQRETTLVWDKATGQPAYNAIVWQDTRTDPICAKLAQDGGQDRFRAQTGLTLSTYFAGPKLQWLLDHVPGLRARAERGEVLFGTMDTFLIWHLTGGAHVTDVSNASRTLLMNLATLDWDDALLDAMRIPRGILPTIRPSSEAYATATGALAGVPVAGDLGDQQAALFGQTCFGVGEAKNTYGTGCFMLLNTGPEPKPSLNGLLTTVAYKLGVAPAQYALEGSIPIAGALVQWLRDNLGLIEQAAEIETLARSVADNGGAYFVPAFSGLYAPYWKSDARGAIVGLTRYVNKGHLARAALEATAFQTREVLEAMQKDSGVRLEALKVDGGMVVNETLMQFQADLLGVPVIRPTVAETTALGAAYAAGLAVGFWASQDELRTNWGEGKRWAPQMDGTERERLYHNWKKAVTRTFDWAE